MQRFLLSAIVCCLCFLSVRAQNYSTVSLEGMQDFANPGENWQLVSQFYADPFEAQQYATSPGQGIIANLQSDDHREHLFTSWSHADIELDLEVQMPKGSNSGLYFMSRYEIQLLDSWGKPEVNFSDIGGIYQRWDESRPNGEKGYEGVGPSVNVARAPGLWQHLNIIFRAPRFNDAGEKTENARFIRVTLNGVVIHENVDVTGPTRAAAHEDTEVASAPLMIQGDHGPVAFRNIKYKLFSPETVSTDNLVFNYYRGQFNWQMPDLNDLTLVSESPVEAIDAQLADTFKLFAMDFTGDLVVPQTGLYDFEVAFSTRYRLTIDGNVVLGDGASENIASVGEFPRHMAQVRLTAGRHPFSLAYAKGNWHNVPTALGFYATGPDQLRTELSAPGSLPADPFADYKVKPSDRPVMVRNFVYHKGEPRTHAISIGEPSGLHYSYDLNQGALLHVWKGSFVDTSTMWYQRGNEQSGVPLGSVIERSGKPVVALLDDANAAWPDSSSVHHFRSYRLDADGRPSFHYDVGTLAVADALLPDTDNRYLTRTIVVEGNGERAYALLAESDTITERDEGGFLIDDQRLYIMLHEGNAMIRQDGDAMQLVAPLDLSSGRASVSFDIIW